MPLGYPQSLPDIEAGFIRKKFVTPLPPQCLESRTVLFFPKWSKPLSTQRVGPSFLSWLSLPPFFSSASTFPLFPGLKGKGVGHSISPPCTGSAFSRLAGERTVLEGRVPHSSPLSLCIDCSPSPAVFFDGNKAGFFQKRSMLLFPPKS